MITSEILRKVRIKMKRRIHHDELIEVAHKMGKQLPPPDRHGGKSYQWEESEIPEVIQILKEIL